MAFDRLRPNGINFSLCQINKMELKSDFPALHHRLCQGAAIDMFQFAAHR